MVCAAEFNHKLGKFCTSRGFLKSFRAKGPHKWMEQKRIGQFKGCSIGHCNSLVGRITKNIITPFYGPTFALYSLLLPPSVHGEHCLIPVARPFMCIYKIKPVLIILCYRPQSTVLFTVRLIFLELVGKAMKMTILLFFARSL